MTSNEKRAVDARLQSGIDLYQGGRLQDAITDLWKLTRDHKTSPKAWGYLGFLLYEAEDMKSTAASFRNAVKLSPESERASLGLFFALRGLGRFPEALRELGRFATVGKPQKYIQMMRGAASELGEQTGN